jgi:hypothetical protein
MGRYGVRGPVTSPAGRDCPEGWTLYQYPGPGFEGIGENSAESSYYSWVDAMLLRQSISFRVPS